MGSGSQSILLGLKTHKSWPLAHSGETPPIWTCPGLRKHAIFPPLLPRPAHLGIPLLPGVLWEWGLCTPSTIPGPQGELGPAQTRRGQETPSRSHSCSRGKGGWEPRSLNPRDSDQGAASQVEKTETERQKHHCDRAPQSCHSPNFTALLGKKQTTCKYSHISPGKSLQKSHFLLSKTPRGRYCHYPHFTQEEVGAQRS